MRLIQRQARNKVSPFARKGVQMFRLLSAAMLAVALAGATAAAALAEGQGQPVLVKVYKDPG